MRSARLATAVTIMVVGLLGATPAMGVPPTPHPAVSCRDLSIPVTLGASQPLYLMGGRLCVPAGATVLQVLVPGFTYSSDYWDFPYEPDRYSYVRVANTSGFATLNIDRPGAGSSALPPSQLPPAAALTVDSEADALHQVLRALPAIAGGNRFARTMLVGHSLGATVSAVVAAKFPGDVDGVILTSDLHSTPSLGADDPNHPAAEEPEFAGYPAGYVTTRKGVRGPLFYDTDYADPKVIAEDDKRKSTGTISELATGNDASGSPTVSQGISVPVLLVVGRNDHIYCAQHRSCADAEAVLTHERGYYTAAPELAAFVLPEAGHSINLHPNARDWFDAAIKWTTDHVAH
ncbi:alpha/beta fold hydrolase [Nocardia sp. NPDC046473]|uniref:alpha/beta hydrolase n=1 Tax=Nocardia sp. NPDC046473 TaxID=3155733 RepID=UPI0033C81B1A